MEQMRGEMNNQKRKSESQASELKKTLVETGQSLAAFEQALVRKSEECNNLYFQLEEMKGNLKKAEEQLGNKVMATGMAAGASAGRIFKRISTSGGSVALGAASSVVSGVGSQLRISGRCVKVVG
jgi:hypothetical protein